MPPADPGIDRTVWLSDINCPQCGTPLATDGRHAWCSSSARPGETQCLYGITTRVWLEDVPR